MVDSDEFITSRAAPEKTLREMILEKYSDCGIISIPWLLYSWGTVQHTSKNNVRRALNYRWGYDKRYNIENITMVKFRNRDEFIESKVIFRTDFVPHHSNLHAAFFSIYRDAPEKPILAHAHGAFERVERNRQHPHHLDVTLHEQYLIHEASSQMEVAEKVSKMVLDLITDLNFANTSLTAALEVESQVRARQSQLDNEDTKAAFARAEESVQNFDNLYTSILAALESARAVLASIELPAEGLLCFPRSDGPFSCATNLPAERVAAYADATQVPDKGNERKGFFVDADGIHPEELGKWCPFSSKMAATQAPQIVAFSEADIPHMDLIIAHYRVKSQDDWERKLGLRLAFEYGNNSAEANRMDIYDDFMTSVRLKARTNHPDYLKAAAIFKSCPTEYFDFVE